MILQYAYWYTSKISWSQVTAIRLINSSLEVLCQSGVLGVLLQGLCNPSIPIIPTPTIRIGYVATSKLPKDMKWLINWPCEWSVRPPNVHKWQGIRRQWSWFHISRCFFFFGFNYSWWNPVMCTGWNNRCSKASAVWPVCMACVENN